MRKTKIICTLGPACSSVKDISKLLKAGMDCARINMSHSSLEAAEQLVDNIRSAQDIVGKSLSIMIDTKGPEIRISTFKEGQVELREGQEFSFVCQDIIGDETKVSLKYTKLIEQVEVGQIIYANNAQLVLEVVKILQGQIICKVLFGGVLSSNKAINVPSIAPQVDFLSKEDEKDLLFAIKNNVSYVAASFVSSENDVRVLKDFLKENKGENIKVISKIENNVAVNNLEKILEISDGIMVARGDLGVDIAIENLPLVQKKAVAIAKKHGKIVIIATEMLESMTTSLRPTRAEVSDVAGAVFEMATSTMLSGETAVGINPENVVRTMAKVQKTTENAIDYTSKFLSENLKAQSIQDSISKTVCTNAIELDAKLIVVFTNSGETARLVSRYRISTPILALTDNINAFNAMSLYWNTLPYLIKYDTIKTEHDMQEFAKQISIKLGLAGSGDIIIVNHGRLNKAHSTDTLKIMKV